MLNRDYQGLHCPHWATITKSCQLNKGGLFIPVAEHVKVYCQSPNYSSCQQLISSASNENAATERGESINRRRYERTPSRFYVRVSEYKPSDLAEIPIDESACTVDLSPGGIRLESSSSLPLDSLVSFYMDKGFTDTELRCIGKVRWCKSLANTSLYHAGIDFVDDMASNVFRRHLGLVVN